MAAELASFGVNGEGKARDGAEYNAMCFKTCGCDCSGEMTDELCVGGVVNGSSTE